MKLKTILLKKKKTELQDICRYNEIRGFSNVDLAGLVNLVFHAMNNKDEIKKLVNNYSDSTQNLIAVLMKIGKDCLYSETKAIYQTYFPRSRFSNNLLLLVMRGLIFLDETDEDSRILIPDEFIPWITETIQELGITLEISDSETPDEEEKIELPAYSTFNSLLYSSELPIEQLRFILADKFESTEGTKSMLITRLLYELRVPPEEILDKAFMKEGLRDIAENLQITKGGNRTELISRIVNTLPLKPTLEQFDKKQASKTNKEQDGEEYEAENIEGEIKEKPPTLLQFLVSDKVESEKIREFLAKNNLDTSGARKIVVRRLLENGIDISAAFDYFFGIPELKDLCRCYGEKVGGTKSELIQRILNLLPKPKNLEVGNQSKMVKVSGPASIKTDIPVPKVKSGPKIPTQNKEVERSPKSLPRATAVDEVFDLIVKKLDANQNFQAGKIKKDSDLNILITTMIEAVGYKCEQIKTNGQFIIQIEDSNVVIFPGVMPGGQAEIRTILGTLTQICDMDEYESKDMIAIIWDSQNKVSTETQRSFEKRTKGHLWYRNKN